MTKQVAFRLTPEMYRLVTVMRRIYGTDADVLRAGIMALWREFDVLPSASAAPPFPDSGDPLDAADDDGE